MKKLLIILLVTLILNLSLWITLYCFSVNESKQHQQKKIKMEIKTDSLIKVIHDWEHQDTVVRILMGYKFDTDINMNFE